MLHRYIIDSKINDLRPMCTILEQNLTSSKEKVNCCSLLSMVRKIHYERIEIRF